MDVLLWIFVSLSAIGLSCYALQVIATRFHLSQKRHAATGIGGSARREFVPPVSILKPLKGLDDHLYDNLESFCKLDYPCFEMIFCLEDRNDPAHKVASKIVERHPEVDLSMVVGECRFGLNPKVNNLLSGYKIAKYPFVLISDSNVSVAPSYLREIVEPMQDHRVGLVSNPIRGVGGRTVSSVMENLHLNSFVMGSVCFLERFLGMACVVGKSMLIRRSQFEALGGFEVVRDVLAEDYILGKAFQEAGYKVLLSSFLIDNVNEHWGLKQFLNRHTRWAKIRWRIEGLWYVFELIANPVLISFLSVLVMGARTEPLALFTVVSGLKIIGDRYLGALLGSQMKPLHYILSVPKDLLIGVLWFLPLVSQTVTWRGHRYHIGRETSLSPLPS